MLKKKVKPWTFKFIEKELEHYHETIKELEFLKQNIIHAVKQTDENGIASGSGNKTSPTEHKGIAITESLEIRQLERITNAIRIVTDKLPPEHFRLIQLKYWARPQTLTWDGVALQLNVSRMTALRWRHEIIYAIIEFTGHR